MKIAFISVWYSNNMGYIENCLPKAMASLGHEVHIISSTAQVYYNDPDYDNIYKPYLGDNIVNEGIELIDGFTLHRLPFKTIKNKIYLKKLKKKLKEIKPDVVQVFDCFSFLTLQAAFYKMIFKYKFFTANHTVASVFPLIQKKNPKLTERLKFFLTRTIPGKIISWLTSRCYPATIDALEISVKYYGISKKKNKLLCLGVDTDFFKPTESFKTSISEKSIERKKFGVIDNEILCIYTGRFTEGKNPLCLAKAIELLIKKGESYKALFMGDGPQMTEISKRKGCFVHKFVPYHELPLYYNIADIGVWPKQESTSMLDAAACGLPIVISNKVLAKERVEGNGLTYIENDELDLANVLLQMKDKTLREELGKAGIKKINENFSWNKLAKDRIEDYKIFIKKNNEKLN